MSMGTLDDEKGRLAALAKWAKRVVDNVEKRGIEERRSERIATNIEISLIPVDQQTLKPKLDRRIKAIARDLSQTGIGVLSNQPLGEAMYFCELTGHGGIFLLRTVRERAVRGAIREYGFMILDRYESYQHLRET